MKTQLNITFDEEQPLDFNIQLIGAVEKTLNDFNFFAKEKDVKPTSIKIVADNVILERAE